MIDCKPTSCQELFGSVHMYRPFPDLASLTTPGRKKNNLKLARKGLEFQVFILSNFVAHFHYDIYLREGFKYSKWKFKMFFSMKGGSRVPHTYSEK